MIWLGRLVALFCLGLIVSTVDEILGFQRFYDTLPWHVAFLHKMMWMTVGSIPIVTFKKKGRDT
jgi:hypothetical protein